MLHDVVGHILPFCRLLIIGFILKKNTFKVVIKLVYALHIYIYGTVPIRFSAYL